MASAGPSSDPIPCDGPSYTDRDMSTDIDEPPVTGDEALDEALRQVARLGEVPLAEHPVVLRRAHDALQDFLNSGANAA